MRRIWDRIVEEVDAMRYEGGVWTGLYWFIRVAVIAIPIGIVAVIGLIVYCNINGIPLPF